MDTPRNIRESLAGVMLKRLVEQFTYTNRDTTTFEMAISRVSPPEREHFKEAFKALVEYKLVAEQSGEFFVTQYGALFLEYAIPAFERRLLPFTEDERQSALTLLREAVSSDFRFDFGSETLSEPHKPRPPIVTETSPANSRPVQPNRTFEFGNGSGPKLRNTQWSAIPKAVPASTGVYWVGFAVFVLVIWGVLAILMK